MRIFHAGQISSAWFPSPLGLYPEERPKIHDFLWNQGWEKWQATKKIWDSPFPAPIFSLITQKVALGHSWRISDPSPNILRGQNSGFFLNSRSQELQLLPGLIPTLECHRFVPEKVKWFLNYFWILKKNILINFFSIFSVLTIFFSIFWHYFIIYLDVTESMGAESWTNFIFIFIGSGFYY